MNKIITVLIVGMAVIIAIGFLVVKQQSRESVPSGETSFNADDNLDQALEDLEQVF